MFDRPLASPAMAGAHVTSTSNCLIFLDTSEPYKHLTPYGCLSRKNIIQASSFCRCLLHEFHDIFVCHPLIIFS